MTDTTVSIPTSQIDNPLSENASINQRVTPEGITDAGILLDESSDCAMRNVGNLAWYHRGEVMVHNVDVEAQELGDLTRYIERHDLPRAVREHFVAGEKTLHEQTALGRPISLANDINIRPQVR